MIRLRLREALRRDEGVAMIFVISIGMIVAILAAAMFASVLQNQRTTRYHRNITSAHAAAEAGLDDAIYLLGQGTNWAQYAPGGSQAWTQSSPNSLTLGTNQASAAAWMTTGPNGNYYVYVKGSFGGNTRTIRATVTRGSPPAFDYSMFASKGIDIHQHGGYLSPQVWTTAVHSNGYINLDWPSEFNVNNLEAVGALTLEKGGGKTPAGNVGASGYSWLDPLNGLCYTGGYAHPGGIAPSNGQCPYSYPGGAVIAGSVYAGSLTLGSHGIIKAVAPLTLDTGQVLDGGSINGSVLTGSSSVNCATSCNKSSPVGGQVQGSITVQSGYAPPVIPFPSIDYSTQVRPYAQAHGTYYSSTSAFMTFAQSTTANYYNADSSGNLTPWSSNTSHYPDAIVLSGTFDVNGGGLSFNWGTVQKAVEAATGLTGGAPIIIIQGALYVEAGGITLNSGLVVVGSDNRVNGIVIPGSATTPVTISPTALLDPNATQPGVLAAGGSIDSSDYDTDSPWSSTSTYEPLKSAPVYVRGLVYSAAWSAQTGTSIPENQHWHNFDPKNLMKVYGSQVGADLHDCNNFSFTYDPIVKNAFGFGGGSVKVLDYQELGT